MNIKIQEIKRIIKKYYDTEAIKIEKLQGFYDENFAITTATRKKYFLKIYRVDKLPSIIFQIDFMAFCSRQGLPVAEIIATKTGKKYFQFRNTYGIMQKFIKGRHLSETTTPKLIREAGIILGKLHTITKNTKFHGGCWKKYVWDLAQFNLAVNHYKTIKQNLNTEINLLIKPIIDNWKNNKKEITKLRKGIIHGDFHGWNLLIDNNNIVAIIDFGDAIHSYYLADVAIAMAEICLRNEKKIESAKIFLKGYLKFFNLTRNEWQLLLLFVQMRVCSTLIEFTYESKTDDNYYKKIFNQALRVLRYFHYQSNQLKFFQLLNINENCSRGTLRK